MNAGRYQDYSRRAEIVHHFAENQAQTLGVFHGIHEAAQRLAVEGEPVGAINIVLFDLLQIMIVRICALCDTGNRPDDVQMSKLIEAVNEPSFRKYLVEKEQRWQQVVGFRARPVQEIDSHVAVLNEQWRLVSAEGEAMRRMKHYRNKALVHATTGLDHESKPIIGDIWKVSRLLLSTARYVRLILEHEDWNYLEHSEDGKARGEALVQALHRESQMEKPLG
jgi:hypothetical protein